MPARMIKGTLSVLLAALATVASGAQSPGGDPTSLEVRAALQRGGLQEAARVSSGFYRKTEPAPELVTSDLTFVAHLSDAVVIGVPVSNRCHLTKDGMSITTDFRVAAGDVLKGDVPQGRDIVVSVPGGMMKFADGLTAEVRVLGLLPPRAGSRVVMFLEKNDSASDEQIAWANGAPLYRVVLGPMGMYTLGADDASRIRLNTYKAHPGFQHRNETTGAFLQAVRAAIAEAEPQGKGKGTSKGKGKPKR